MASTEDFQCKPTNTKPTPVYHSQTIIDDPKNQFQMFRKKVSSLNSVITFHPNYSNSPKVIIAFPTFQKNDKIYTFMECNKTSRDKFDQSKFLEIETYTMKWGKPETDVLSVGKVEFHEQSKVL